MILREPLDKLGNNDKTVQLLDKGFAEKLRFSSNPEVFYCASRSLNQYMKRTWTRKDYRKKEVNIFIDMLKNMATFGDKLDPKVSTYMNANLNTFFELNLNEQDIFSIAEACFPLQKDLPSAKQWIDKARKDHRKDPTKNKNALIFETESPSFDWNKYLLNTKQKFINNSPYNTLSFFVICGIISLIYLQVAPQRTTLRLSPKEMFSFLCIICLVARYTLFEGEVDEAKTIRALAARASNLR
jgi:hypothetical protein